MRKIHTLVWHYTATPKGREVSVDEVRQWHRARGFADVGYHKLVHLDGSVSEGRPERQGGAHVKGRNTGTLGYCYVGGLRKAGDTNGTDTRTAAQKATILRLTKEAIAKYDLTDVCGHRDLAATDCPGFNARREYGDLLRTAPPGPPDEDPADDTSELKASRTVRAAATGEVLGAAKVAESTHDIVSAAQQAESSLSTGTIVGLAIGVLIMIACGVVLYARWDDAGRPTPWKRKEA